MDERRWTYTETFDPEALKRFDKAVVRTFWRNWIEFALLQAYHFAFACLIAVGMYAWLTGHGFDGPKMLLAALAGVILGTFTATAKAFEHSQERRSQAAGTVLQCEISDEGYGYTHGDGTSIFHPWNTMQVAFEHADGILVDTSNGPISVDRRALAAAGLEEEFLSRVKRNAPTAKRNNE